MEDADRVPARPAAAVPAQTAQAGDTAVAAAVGCTALTEAALASEATLATEAAAASPTSNCAVARGDRAVVELRE